MLVASFMLVACTVTTQANVANEVSNKSMEISVTQTNTNGAQPIDSAAVKAAALSPVPNYEIVKVTLNDVTNDDGTPKTYFLVRDDKGQYWDADSVEQAIKRKRKLIGVVAGNVGKGILTGAVTGLLSGKATKKKNGAAIGTVVGAVAGGITGFALSSNERKQIKEIRGQLKNVSKMMEAYKDTFTEEGVQKDLKADLSDFNISEESQSLAEFKEALKNSPSAPKLEDLAL